MEQLFASTTVRGVVAIIALLLALKVVIGLFKKPEVDKFHIKVKCRDCTWTGKVGKFNKTCPSCNSKNVKPVAG